MRIKVPRMWTAQSGMYWQQSERQVSCSHSYRFSFSPKSSSSDSMVETTHFQIVILHKCYDTAPGQLLTPCSAVLLEDLTGPQLVKKCPALHGTRRFITAFTKARHLSLSRATSIQNMPHPTSWRSILILFCHLRTRVMPAEKMLGFDPGPVRVGFVTETVALGQVL
jgi:hypothetical protein